MKKLILLRTVLLFTMSFLIFLNEGHSQNEDVQKKYREFDFWIGEWDVYKYGTDTLVGNSQIESILDGVVIKESYQSTANTYRGTSYNKYNQSKKRWEQYWVDNAGTTLHILGGLENGNMVLQNVESQNETPRNRITFSPDEDGTVRQTWDQSSDKGVSWKTVFDGHYRSKSD